MNLSNRAKRNIWLLLAILAAVATVDRLISLINGEKDWFDLLTAVLITVFCTRFYLCYRRHVKNGNLFGPVRPHPRDKEHN